MITCPVTSTRTGTSDTFASTTVALLRSLYLKKYGTEASWESVERWLRDGASASSTGPALNGESAARLAGLADVLDRAKARASAAQFEPTTPSIAPDPDTPGRVSTDDSSGAVVAAPQTEPTSSPWNAGTAAKSPPDRLPRPRASATWRDRRLSVVLYTRSAFAGRLRIATRGPMNRTDVVQILPLGARHRFVLRAPRKPRAVSIRLLPLSGDDIEPSPLLTLRPRSKGYR